MPNTWYIAPALETLRLQLNKAFPKRSKASDGGIGDAAHASRSSDHNPWVKDKKGVGVVTARDFTHDPKTGIDCQWLADTLVKHKDPRIKYIIWNRQICSSATSPWKWRKYTGVNGHTKHLHLSVNSDQKYWNDASQWTLDFPKEKTDDIAKVTQEDSAADKSSSTSGQASADNTATPPAPTPPPNDNPQPLPEPVAVAQVSAEKEADREVSGIQASTAGAATFITTTLGGVMTFLSGYGWQIVVGVAVFGGLFVVARFWYANREKERIASERMERERRAHELQLALIEAAADQKKNTVTLVPPPLPVPNSEPQQEAKQ